MKDFSLASVQKMTSRLRLEEVQAICKQLAATYAVLFVLLHVWIDLWMCRASETCTACSKQCRLVSPSHSHPHPHQCRYTSCTHIVIVLFQVMGYRNFTACLVLQEAKAVDAMLHVVLGRGFCSAGWSQTVRKGSALPEATINMYSFCGKMQML